MKLKDLREAAQNGKIDPDSDRVEVAIKTLRAKWSSDDIRACTQCGGFNVRLAYTIDSDTGPEMAVYECDDCEVLFNVQVKQKTAR